MTRATLLHVLDRPTALGPAEVRELEQLAQAFPYCQTAHLLLAKAAHDQGTMLAGQRLRRAATYAADRTLLRRLIEQQEPTTAPEPVAVSAAPHPLDLVDWPDEFVPPAAPAVAPPLPAAVATPTAAEALPPVAPPPTPAPLASPSPAAAARAAEPPASADALPLPAPAVLPGPEAEIPTVPAPSLLPAVVPVVAGPVDTQVLHALAPPAAAVAQAETPDVAPMATAAANFIAPKTPETALPAPATEDAAVTVEPAPAAVLPAAAPSGAFVPAASAASEAAALPVAAVALATGLEESSAERPAQAPAIRPPAAVGEARFEFGLADAAPAAGQTAYELPGLVDEWAASAVTRGLGSPEALALAAPTPAAPVFTPAAFTGDAVVGYAYGESSRLGFSMQLLDLLAANAEAAESATAVVAAAQPPASALPPTGAFFEPDPLLLDHWATHRPVALEQPSTVDLINNFLRRQPRLTRPAMLPPAATHQADLSVRSTRAEPDLVSENLARIFVRQGKTARAIEIYEKLMVKQPEKMAYFAAQIQSLHPSA